MIVGSSVIHLWSESASQRLINDVHFIMIIWMLLTAEQSKVPGFIFFSPGDQPLDHKATQRRMYPGSSLNLFPKN